MSPRFTPYLGIVAALALGVFIATFSGTTVVQHISESAVQNASSTISVVTSGSTLPPIQLPDLESVAEIIATSSTPATVPGKSAPLKTVSSAPVTLPAPPVSSDWNAALDASAFDLRSALVNIICYAPAGSRLRSISGSGVIIDSKGIILTNAHIAQNFLLKDQGVSCKIRAGGPATDKYEASLIHIPFDWIKTNAKILTETNPSGTGEYDFAFLAISKSVTRDELPASFPYIPLATLPPNIGTPVVIASYGAQFLESSQIRSSLFPTVVFGSVKNVFTFASTSIDVLALGGSAAAQEGSSGGGVADINGQLVGTITTSTTKGTTDTRSLDAITASYIRAAYASETGEALDLLLAKPTASSISAFAPQIPALEAILTANL
ncbi:MAG: serine protease [bacterium]|nr:serine protease [bacterium]